MGFHPIPQIHHETDITEEKIMNFTNLGGNIFNLDNIVRVEEYNGTGKGLVHCMDGHA